MVEAELDGGDRVSPHLCLFVLSSLFWLNDGGGKGGFDRGDRDPSETTEQRAPSAAALSLSHSLSLSLSSPSLLPATAATVEMGAAGATFFSLFLSSACVGVCVV
ncbi:hypothetical protein PIB30_060581 [Stylosanthes scabra]|uniref:Uncharacterized protein n=1 Tax=Stylosanthes scabra TaxID=79078 RepID=A0ABU6XKS2_9FABA|nr:hypothetical protein [Stylosanthes scabra]